MARDKDLLKAIVREQFYRVGENITKAKAAQDAHRQALANVEALSTDYKPEYIASQKAKAMSEFTAKNQALYSDTAAQLEKLKGALLELHGSLDLADPRWQNALKMVEMAGKDLSGDTVRQMVKQFEYDQPALTALQSVFKARGMPYDGGIDKMIYDPASAVEKLAEHAYVTLIQQGASPFSFGVAAGKIAALEGYGADVFPWANPFPSQAMAPVEHQVNVASMRAAAGLPAEVK